MKRNPKTSSVRVDAGPEQTEQTGLLQRYLEMLERHGRFRINFEDLTGVTKDIPDMHVSPHFRMHTCDYCMFAKSTVDSHQECIRNKMAANRLVIHRRKPFAGFCHLGVTDLVRPLIYQEQVLGVFFCGSFVNRDTEDAARARILKYCQRRGLEPDRYLAQWSRMPRLGKAEIAEGWRDVDLAADIAIRVIENSGLPAKRYRTRSGAQYMVWQGRMPAIVSCTLRYLNQHYSENFRLTEIAESQGCHPDYLSRIFKRTVGIGASEYLHRLRIDHARRLLLMERFSVGEIGFMVGFYDQSHFGRIFRRFVGMSPIDFRRSAQDKEAERKDLDIEYFEYSNLRSFNPHILPDSRSGLAERASR